MNNKKLNMSDLEKEMALVETDAVVEEQYNADRNYSSLDNELRSVIAQIPYPQTEKYTTGMDYEDRQNLIYEKERNAPYWDKRDIIERYCNNGSLYSGHLNINGSNYYIMDSRLVATKTIKVDGEEIKLINVDDRVYGDYVRWWRYPSENRSVQFSRNITMYNRRVSDVDIILDKGNELFSNISDAYLRKALIRNKDKTSVQSIIQTIQKKQDSIRSLPTEKSFIVQGCAGSGKTMVLLHRLRYLLYNKDIYNDEYIFLVPGNGFKEFIDEISTNFNINKKNILPYQEYYQELLGKKVKDSAVDTSELVFAPEYLGKVYSKAFMQEAYKGIFDSFVNQTESLITFCEDKLNDLLDFEKLLLEDEITTAKKEAIKNATESAKRIQDFTKTKIENTFGNIALLISEIEEVYAQRKREYEIASNPEVTITISPDDERILSNEKLVEVKKSIDAESLAVEKASIFTALSHKNKLKKLQENYDVLYEELVSVLIEEDKKKYAEQASQLVYVYGDISLTEAETILETLKGIIVAAEDSINQAQSNLDNINEYLGEKFAKEIENLNRLIVVSGDIANIESNYVETLTPSYTFFEENILLGTELLDSFSKHITADKDKEFIRYDLSLYAKRTQNQLYAYLNTLLFNACKKKIATDFEIKVCDVYKHYWYLALYCQYLTRPLKAGNKKYIFIDEAQDLSVAEIELINKVNSISGEPTINLFGDTNQMITTHGIKDWSDLQIVPEIYTLEENFRNTNQIVEYCNKNLTIQMVKIGVDMDEVSEYKTIQDAVRSSSSISNNAVFIVKDDYCVADLKKLLSQTTIKNYEIYTVKAAKGLEFKEVFVFDEKMSLNEKYISYTRALAKLNVIKSLPQTTDRTTTLIVQGNDDEEVSEITETTSNVAIQPLVEYCQTMKMSYSYKPVLILSILNSKEYSISINEAVKFFREFYETRRKNGQIVEKENCIYQRDDATDEQISANIITNPLTAIKKSGFFEYSPYSKEIKITDKFAKQITPEDAKLLSSICKQKLDAYFAMLNNN